VEGFARHVSRQTLGFITSGRMIMMLYRGAVSLLTPHQIKFMMLIHADLLSIKTDSNQSVHPTKKSGG
jgi:hypothetical protein